MVEKINERCFGPANHNPMYPAQKTHKKQQWGQTRMALPLSEVGPPEPSSQVATQGRLPFGWLPQQQCGAPCGQHQFAGNQIQARALSLRNACPWPSRRAPLLCQHRGAARQSPRGGSMAAPRGGTHRHHTAQVLGLVLLRAVPALLGTQAPHAGTVSTSPLVPLVQQHVGSNFVIMGISPFLG